MTDSATASTDSTHCVLSLFPLRLTFSRSRPNKTYMAIRNTCPNIRQTWPPGALFPPSGPPKPSCGHRPSTPATEWALPRSSCARRYDGSGLSRLSPCRASLRGRAGGRWARIARAVQYRPGWISERLSAMACGPHTTVMVGAWECSRMGRWQFATSV